MVVITCIHQGNHGFLTLWKKWVSPQPGGPPRTPGTYTPLKRGPITPFLTINRGSPLKMIIFLSFFPVIFHWKTYGKQVDHAGQVRPLTPVIPTPFLLKNSWEKKPHDIISRYTNNILRYQFQDIFNIVMNAPAMVKGQGCQESGAMYWAVPMRVNVLSAIFAKEPRSLTQGRYLDLQTGVHCQNFETMISLFFAPNFMLPWKAIELTLLHTT